ncbi:MAG TPA: hypothetical protein VMG98_13025 [Verrucomicrobiae bacterium]|nr:hypothetical protein [Verrucomicrobiae bacterium]
MQLTPFVPVVQSELVAIVTETGAEVGLGVAPSTVYTAIAIVAALDEMYAGFRVLDELPLLGIKTLTVAPVVCGAPDPLCGSGLDPPPPPQATTRAAKAARPAPKTTW